MSRFSKFCKFLSETGEGLKLVAFFVAAQHLFVAYYEGDPDFAVYMGELRWVSKLITQAFWLDNDFWPITEPIDKYFGILILRDRFFDETSCWCLPTKILELTEEQSNSIGKLWSLQTVSHSLSCISYTNCVFENMFSVLHGDIKTSFIKNVPLLVATLSPAFANERSFKGSWFRW